MANNNLDNMTDEEKRILAHYMAAATGQKPVESYKDKPIDYQETAPKPFEVKVDLVEVFERITRYKADAWQVNFCEYLQNACVNRHIKRTWAAVHAEGQLGKSSILVQIYPAWILGHDPMHRIALATYNVSRSQSHSKAVIHIMNTPEYKEIFRDPAGWVKPGTAISGWQTQARIDSTESQLSYNPVGLQSGLTGSGYETLLLDDPYADQKEAFSDTVRKNLQEFWDFTVGSRMSLYTNVLAMFHRYSTSDLAGYLLDTGDFDYLRYASIADGDYEHPSTGQVFKDPLGRKEGELISPTRRPLLYYEKVRKNARVWYSMFQGRPTSEEGEFFNISKIKMLDEAETAQRRAECVSFVRAWDNAATKDGGDTTSGTLMGISADGRATIFHGELVQADSGGRIEKQKAIAMIDGRDIPIRIPQDPGSAGKDTVFFTKKELEGYTIETATTTGSKESRAEAFSAAVNSGDVSMAIGDWNKQYLEAYRNFPLSDFDDPVDSSADAFNFIFAQSTKGRVIKNYAPARNIISWAQFTERFDAGEKVPANFRVYVGVKVTPDASRPNSAVIVAQAPVNANMPDTLFVIAEYKEYTDDLYATFEWLDAAINCYCERSSVTIWLHPDSSAHKATIWQKLRVPVNTFKADAVSGLTELDWHLREADRTDFGEKGSHLYGIVHDVSQLAVATNEFGLANFRQEVMTWHFDDKGKPSAVGAVLDCVRMVTFAFRTSSEPLTKEERVEQALPVAVRATTIAGMPDSREKDSAMQKRLLEIVKAKQKIDTPVRGAHVSRYARK